MALSLWFDVWVTGGSVTAGRAGTTANVRSLSLAFVLLRFTQRMPGTSQETLVIVPTYKERGELCRGSSIESSPPVQVRSADRGMTIRPTARGGWG